MTASGASRNVIRGILIVIVALIVIGALTWLRFAEPWYSHQLVERMQVGSYQEPWRNETSKIADLIPDGMSRAAALALVKQNGFSCPAIASNNTKTLELQCTRKISSFVCSINYVVSFLVEGESVRALHAQSYQACL